MRSLLGLGLALSAVLAVVGCSTEDENPPAAKTPDAEEKKKEPESPAAKPTGPLEQTACRYLIPTSAEGKQITCYDLVVPESRRPGADAKKTIKLHLARIKGKEGGVPTIELTGGPGGGGEQMVGGIVAGQKDLVEAYAPLLAKGDLVIFDQRGVGRSVPRLSCDSEDPEACKAALEAKGIDLSAYDTVENADDVHDMKVALGVAQIDLHGISYGTRLALEIVKRHADDVRATIIDGVMPPDVPIMGMFPVALDGIIQRTFDACKADTKCNATYPDLDGTMTKLKAKLEKTPFQAHNYEYGEDYEYDWRAFVEDLVQRSYSDGTAAKVPYWLHSLLKQTQAEFTAAEKKAEDEFQSHYADEDAAAAANPLLAEYIKVQQAHMDDEEAYQAQGMANGMYLSVTCNDYGQHETLAASQAAQAKIRKVFQDEDAVKEEFKDCEVWPKRASEPTVLEPARFTGPVLVIGGDVDPATPVEWAKHAATTLPQSTLVEVPTGGHGLTDTCGGQLKGAFFADPSAKLDAGCAERRKFDFYYAPKTAFHGDSRIIASYRPTRPADTRRGVLADRVLAASVPAAVSNAYKTIKQLAQRRADGR